MGTMAGAAAMLQNATMSVRTLMRSCWFVLVGIGSAWVGPAHASLGGDLASVLADAAEWHGAVQDSPLQQYDVEEILTDNGLRVREFLDRKGIVFAVAWSGPTVPDLERLLGPPRFVTYTTALAARTRLGLQRSVRVATPELVVESTTQLRNCTGRAYLPAMIPGAVVTADLR
jgi:hypothetical protein